MNTKQTEKHCVDISQEKLLAFVRTMIGGNNSFQDDEHPLPPGPWDPIIRSALKRVEESARFELGLTRRSLKSDFGSSSEALKVAFAYFLAKHPEIYDALGNGHLFDADEVTLNPQPLPPRYSFLVSVAHTVISRVEFLQDIAEAITNEDEQRGIIIVSGYANRFSDDWCGNGFKFKWPFPGPHPHWWFTNGLDGIDLLILATQFEQAAKQSFSPGLQKNLANTSAKFVDAGLSRLQ